MPKRPKLLPQELIRTANEAWLGLGDTAKLKIDNPLVGLEEYWLENIDLFIYKMMKNPDWIYLTVKSLFNVTLHPIQCVVLQEIWKHPFPMLIGSRGFSKSFLMAVYALLITILIPGSKVLVVGAAFRQSKVIFEYAEAIWKNAPVLQSICDSNSGPRRDVDRCTLRINDGFIMSIPIGTGEKIRGLRANIVICDEFDSVPLAIYEQVVGGFNVVTYDPITAVQEHAKREYLISIGEWNDELEDRFNNKSNNQNIVLGTAGYDFGHFAEYWRRYKAIISSEGDSQKLQEIFGPDKTIDGGINYKDFVIIRIPYELTPNGFMQEKQVARAKAVIHNSIFLMEYAACVKNNTKIITDSGCKRIDEIVVGDKVLTHLGRFRSVTKLFKRHYNNQIRKIKTFGYSEEVHVTPEHPFYNNGEWTEAGDMREFVYLPTRNLEYGYIKSRIIYNESEHFSGYVYNLEVEEDNSYCTLNAAVHNCFAKDSMGFFKRTLIESCVGTDLCPIPLPSGPVYFDAVTRGNHAREYVFGIDPAAESDNFSIVILEVWSDHVRIVYCWTMTRAKFKKRLSAGATQEHDFYAYCAKKIFELMDLFPCVRIAIDTQGGGYQVAEALTDPTNIPAGKMPILPIIEEKEKPTDNLPGKHILEFIQFASSEWTNKANNGLRKDMEDFVTLFPRFDAVALALSLENDNGLKAALSKNVNDADDLYDTLEVCMLEIEELKNELTTIVHTKTSIAGRDRWDTPEIKIGNKKGHMRKDRYSALLMANSSARSIARAIPLPTYETVGGFAHQINPNAHKGEKMYSGPAWFEGVNSVNFPVIRRTQ